MKEKAYAPASGTESGVYAPASGTESGAVRPKEYTGVMYENT